ncbi:MAG: hypothetical protein FJZ90_18925, partial [Chloroflexi bacterium]|nr:hypothetical protein [Chloroflexota bacterium]
MTRLGCDLRGVRIMAPKGRFLVLHAESVPYAAASILKQEMLAKDGEAALSGEIYFGGERTTDVLLMATERSLERVLRVLAAQPLPSLVQLGQEIEVLLRRITACDHPTMRIGGREM